jgi:hypothetical protein
LPVTSYRPVNMSKYTGTLTSSQPYGRVRINPAVRRERMEDIRRQSLSGRESIPSAQPA